MTDKKEIQPDEMTPQEVYDSFGEDVKAAAEKAAKVGYQLKEPSEIGGNRLAQYENKYFVNGEHPNGAYNQRMATIRAAVACKFFVMETTPTKKQIDSLKAWEAIVVTKAINFTMLRCGQVDPNF